MAEGSSSGWRPGCTRVVLRGEALWAALEQGKVTLACHPALNAGAVRPTSRAWPTGERDAAYRCTLCRSEGCSPDSLGKCP